MARPVILYTISEVWTILRRRGGSGSFRRSWWASSNGDKGDELDGETVYRVAMTSFENFFFISNPCWETLNEAITCKLPMTSP